MVLVKNEQIATVPVLHIANEEQFDSNLPLVIFQHGFTSAKEHNLHVAYLLAEEGFRVVLPDAKFHGERSENVSTETRNISFWDIVINGIHEIEHIKNELVETNLVDAERVGMSGTSMGGIMTLGALSQYSWIKTAVSLMGNPNYEKFANSLISQYAKEDMPIPLTESQLKKTLKGLRDYDLSLHPERLEGRPLMFWHGQVDSVVPFNDAYQFYKDTQPLYEGREDNLQFIADPGAGHTVSRSGVLATVEWFVNQL